MYIGDHSYRLYLEQRRIEHEDRMRSFEMLGVAMRNLGRCLRDAGMLCEAYDEGYRHGRATGRRLERAGYWP